MRIGTEIRPTRELPDPLLFGHAFGSTASHNHWHDGEYGIKVIAFLNMNIPRPGYVALQCNGYAEFSSHDRIMDIGIGTDPNAFRRSIRMETAGAGCHGGYVFRIPYNITAVLPVTPGIITFYGLARGWPGFSNGKACVNPGELTGLWIPK